MLRLAQVGHLYYLIHKQIYYNIYIYIDGTLSHGPWFGAVDLYIHIYYLPEFEKPKPFKHNNGNEQISDTSNIIIGVAECRRIPAALGWRERVRSGCDLGT